MLMVIFGSGDLLFFKVYEIKNIGKIKDLTVPVPFTSAYISHEIRIIQIRPGGLLPLCQ